MLLPTRKTLLSLSSSGNQQPAILFSCPAIHPDTRLWKYYWQIFTLDSTWESNEFFEKATWLCTANFHKLIDQYEIEGVNCIDYNKRQPRLDPSAPWDMTSAKWNGVTFAPLWIVDPDPIWNGYK